MNLIERLRAVLGGRDELSELEHDPDSARGQQELLRRQRRGLTEKLESAEEREEAAQEAAVGAAAVGDEEAVEEAVEKRTQLAPRAEALRAAVERVDAELEKLRLPALREEALEDHLPAYGENMQAAREAAQGPLRRHLLGLLRAWARYREQYAAAKDAATRYREARHELEQAGEADKMPPAPSNLDQTAVEGLERWEQQALRILPENAEAYRDQHGDTI